MTENAAEKVKPYAEEGSKKEQVAQMFDNISGRYDLLNHVLSLNIDKLWRKKAVKLLSPYKPTIILDVATGTGDFAVELMSLKPSEIKGIDISAGMLEVGKIKMRKRALDKVIELKLGDAENIEFPDNHFEAVTVAFGVRNFENLKAGLGEIKRVLKPGYAVAILEFSKPRTFPMKQLYNIYFKAILPNIGRLVSKDPRAYTYLPESVSAFPEGKTFLSILDEVGYKKIREYRLTFGIATIYLAEK
ncbi:bifunctional demethylmenaquinone methyltransferase/2-methoxy-6-polyprenyl-1,4-benzoquinol methylase UbiE [Salibacteraceae bacterium]|jgi:demethylmenaquinone methyltransferase / 2-methoxy-6-polyprenyl-1,4-benzoquinol methylase|nr:bifunctional demethylmenaquinone methyltransferase/2-methoxy-6-polyprenyl-1,4-benzoquinol methylase UbiE [Salibacteraceae bacterium]MDB4103903.1 bifunctional demethylmenaquinone methyltransferase/2-methoxy-6-polyprenyl-1,4-benzoquinol methylase UbiE [Salibacteraceae bacterium]MDB9709699.1 bifunctional demethylmenaquinone methyltransferase/2-methoxy-6-polyprenyl-1,4-benzoquinol methylase UbiE [Salibacteraceae bacterium]